MYTTLVCSPFCRLFFSLHYPYDDVYSFGRGEGRNSHLFTVRKTRTRERWVERLLLDPRARWIAAVVRFVQHNYLGIQSLISIANYVEQRQRASHGGEWRGGSALSYLSRINNRLMPRYGGLCKCGVQSLLHLINHIAGLELNKTDRFFPRSLILSKTGRLLQVDSRDHLSSRCDNLKL